MKQLTCEMCGSTDLLKQDGVFVCQTCGTKYSVEEARKMMIEGTVDVSGSSVKIDNTDSINTYLSMAQNAYNANNTAEAETYCNKVIEIDPQNYNAWMLKGQSAGWQSSLANIRLGEAINCFIQAINIAKNEAETDTDDNVNELVNIATDEIRTISVEIVKLQGKRYEQWPDEDEKQGIVTVIKKIWDDVAEYMNTVTVFFDVLSNYSIVVNDSVMNAWDKIILPEYTNDNNGYISEDAYREFIIRADRCEKLLEYAAEISDDDKVKIKVYRSLIKINNTLMSSFCYISQYIDYEQNVSYSDSYTDKKRKIQRIVNHIESKGGVADTYNNKAWFKVDFPSSSKLQVLTKISEWNNKIKQCESNIQAKKQREAEEKKRQQEEERHRKEQEQRERNESYWAEHAETKQQLESERDTLHAQIKQLKEQVAPYDREISKWQKKRESDTPAQKEKKTVEKQISLLRSEQSSLGIFKGKEKKALQAQIDELSSRLPTINESIKAEEKEQIKLCNDKLREIEQHANPIKEKIAAAEKRIGEIQTELTKNR